MSSALVLAGLSLGLLVATTASIGWSGLGQPNETWQVSTARGAKLIDWLATALLLITGWGLWAENRTTSALSLRLVVLAAIAAPAECDAACHHWSRVLRRLPAILLTGMALNQITALPLNHSGTGTAVATVPVVSVALLVCGGLAARTVGEALSNIAAPHLASGWWTPRAIFALLTTLVGGTAFYVLTQYGSLWISTAVVSALAATWLMWSATWLGRHWPSGLYAGLACASGLALTVVALTIG